MKRMLKIYMEKPELAALLLLLLLIILFQIRSGGVFLSFDNLRGFFGILPEMALVAIGAGVFVALLKLGVIVREASRPAIQDYGNYSLDQGREVRPEEERR